jgi:hypothetical protein
MDLSTHAGITALALVSAAGIASAAGVTDYSSRKPASITLPAAGGKYVDPAFGSTIIRVTDSRDGTLCTHAYSYWAAFNWNNTRIMVACDDVVRIYRFNATYDKLTPDGTLTGSDGYPVQFEGATWSTTASATVYALDKRGSRLWKLNLLYRGLAGYTLLKDFSSKLPGVTVSQLHVSDNADVYTFHTKDSNGVRKDAVVWVKSSNRTYVFPRPSTWVVNETNLSKDGKTAMINWQNGAVTIWNYAAGTYKNYLLSDLTANVSGHFDMGADHIVNSDGVRTGLVVRPPDGVGLPANIVQYRRPGGGLNWSLADHVSIRSFAEEWAVGSTYAGDKTWGAFEDEIYMARTDGAGFVRLAHSRSAEVNPDRARRYYAQPRAVSDRQGRYIVFTSDLGSTSRTDVMLLKIPSAYWPQ